MSNILKHLLLGCILTLLIASCSPRSDVATESKDKSHKSMADLNNTDTATIWGARIHLDEIMAIRELSEAGILHCDTVKYNNGKFENAIIEFASVKFCMNKGFLFLTSRQDKQAIDSLVNHISRYYGEPSIDDEGEPEWSYYHWNLYDTIPDRPYIRIRPVHSEEGGLMMTWSF